MLLFQHDCHHLILFKSLIVIFAYLKSNVAFLVMVETKKSNEDDIGQVQIKKKTLIQFKLNRFNAVLWRQAYNLEISIFYLS